MELKLYNTATRKKEVFAPLDPKNVRLYVCGPTVWDYAHIGNARPVIVFDVLFRLLRHLYGESHVTYVRNITDIDDKIIVRAKELQGERNVPIAEVMRELTERTYRQYQEDVAALGTLKPTHEPRATEYVAQMIAMIERLVAAGHAYAADGHVLYDVSSKLDYGKLANRSLDEMIAGARVDVAPYKRGPMDFVLWKPSDAQTPGWDSPWGRGRPGWHIECSAMSEALLGETFDIHGGGIDLVFPHHENEIAQSEGAHLGHPMARFWMHNGFLQVEGEKMSKSLGNFVTINELLQGWHGFRWNGSVLRYAMLMTNYRRPIDWTLERLEQASIELQEFQTWSIFHQGDPPSPEVVSALADDLDTPGVITELRRLLREAKTGPDALLLREQRPGQKPDLIKDGSPAEILGASLVFLGLNMKANFGAQPVREPNRAEVATLIEARNQARKEKNFKESDRIRNELDAMGVVLKDGPQGTTWELKR